METLMVIQNPKISSPEARDTIPAQSGSPLVFLQSTQVPLLSMVALTKSRRCSAPNQSRRRSVLPPQNVAPTQTFRTQQVLTAHISPVAQSELELQSGRPAHGVAPSTQNPVPPVVLAQTQEPPGPHCPKVSHVLPEQLGVTHAPLVQMPEAHSFPHSPQFFGSLRMSAQTPEQSFFGGGQIGSHTPFSQSVSGPHTFPQVPQLELSDDRSGQPPLQRGIPLLSHMQAPDLQVLPAGHTFPQAPQLLLSEVRSGHAPLQGGKPLLVHIQVLDWQVLPAGHTLPHSPQLLESEAVSLHAPPHSCWVGEVLRGPQM